MPYPGMVKNDQCYKFKIKRDFFQILDRRQLEYRCSLILGNLRGFMSNDQQENF